MATSPNRSFQATYHGQKVDIFRSKRREDIPYATSSQSGLTTDAHPNAIRHMAEETRSPAEVYTHAKQNAEIFGLDLNVLAGKRREEKSTSVHAPGYLEWVMKSCLREFTDHIARWIVLARDELRGLSNIGGSDQRTKNK